MEVELCAVFSRRGGVQLFMACFRGSKPGSPAVSAAFFNDNALRPAGYAV
jgi:hypothetical protein